jgi:hypothetical protein
MGLNDSQSVMSHRPGLNRLASYQGHMPRVQQNDPGLSSVCARAPGQILFPLPCLSLFVFVFEKYFLKKLIYFIFFVLN